MSRRIAVICVVLAATSAAGCDEPRTVLGRLLESRRLSAEALLQFAKVTEAGNRAVMADSPNVASAAARDLGVATEAVASDAVALATQLKELSYSREAALLEEFQKRFAEFRAVDREILELAELDTNIKAQRLSFGAAQEAADFLRDALATIVQKAPVDDWRVRAMSAEILSSIREIQVLEAPHIAEPDDAAMSRLEERIGRAESLARKNLAALGAAVRVDAKPAFLSATTALDRFMSVHGEIVMLSRRNSNVRALALALGKRRALASVCEEHLRAIQEALSQRDIGPRRSSWRITRNGVSLREA